MMLIMMMEKMLNDARRIKYKEKYEFYDMNVMCEIFMERNEMGGVRAREY